MSQLVICRTCGSKIYSSNAKNLFDTEDNEIVAKIQILTGIYINEEQHMPKDICGSCHLDLNHSIAFRERCIKTHKLLLMLSERRRKRATLDALKTAIIKSKKHAQLEIARVSIEPHHPLIEQKPKQIHTRSKSHIRKTKISEEVPSIVQQQPNTFCKEEAQQDECPNFEQSVHSDNDNDESQEESHSVENTADSDNEIAHEPQRNPNRQVSQPGATGAKKYVCHQCGRCFADSSNFKVHILRHTGVKDFKCTECGAKFFTRHLLHLHIRVRHLGEKPYACKYCDQRFFTSTSRCRHERVHHTREMPYACRFCGKTYLTKSCLNRHEFLHTGERPYRCDICNVAFPRNTNLKLHFRSKQHQKRADEAVNN